MQNNLVFYGRKLEDKNNKFFFFRKGPYYLTNTIFYSFSLRSSLAFLHFLVRGNFKFLFLANPSGFHYYYSFLSSLFQHYFISLPLTPGFVTNHFQTRQSLVRYFSFLPFFSYTIPFYFKLPNSACFFVDPARAPEFINYDIPSFSDLLVSSTTDYIWPLRSPTYFFFIYRILLRFFFLKRGIPALYRLKNKKWAVKLAKSHFVRPFLFLRLKKRRNYRAFFLRYLSNLWRHVRPLLRLAVRPIHLFRLRLVPRKVRNRFFFKAIYHFYLLNKRFPRFLRKFWPRLRAKKKIEY